MFYGERLPWQPVPVRRVWGRNESKVGSLKYCEQVLTNTGKGACVHCKEVWGSIQSS